MNLSLISNKVSSLITKDLDYSEDKQEIIAYAVETILLFIIGGLFIILLGYALKALLPTIIAATFGGLLRKFSGGAHFNTPYKCLIFGAVVYSCIGVITINLVTNSFFSIYFLLIILFAAFLIVSLYAPVDSASKPIHSRTLRSKLKRLSMLFVCITFILAAVVNNRIFAVSAVLGVFYQSITLLPSFNKRGGEHSL